MKSLDSEIIEITPDDKLIEEIEDAVKYKENVYRALTRIEEAIRATTTAAGVPAPVVPDPTTAAVAPVPLIPLTR